LAIVLDWIVDDGIVVTGKHFKKVEEECLI
jgi:hypothetical protein